MTTAKHCPANERVKRRYFIRLREVKGQGSTTVDTVAAALSRFEQHTGYRDFKKFHVEQVRSFKKHLTSEARGQKSGEGLSSATIASTLRSLRAFFMWLADQPGYRSAIRYSDAEYFTPPGQDERIASGRIERPGPELEDVINVLKAMPVDTPTALRDRALIALIILTGARDRAVTTLKLKHLDLAGGRLLQDAREVRTKRDKTFATTFFPVGDEPLAMVTGWKQYLEEQGFRADDPLFPATAVTLDGNQQFAASGLSRNHWNTTAPVREVFKDAFAKVGLPYHNPHSLRKTLVRLGEKLCQTAEEFKAWSQNLGHSAVLTTFSAYGKVAQTRQADIIKNLGKSPPTSALQTDILSVLQQHGFIQTKT